MLPWTGSKTITALLMEVIFFRGENTSRKPYDYISLNSFFAPDASHFQSLSQVAECDNFSCRSNDASNINPFVANKLERPWPLSTTQ